MRLIFISFFILAAAFLSGCSRKQANNAVESADNNNAKALMQGVWFNEESGNVVFQIKGDSVFYPDSTSSPSAFFVLGDTLLFRGSKDVRYIIVKQTSHLLQFQNMSGDLVKLIKSDDTNDEDFFTQKKPVVVLNQNTLIKRDTVVFHDNSRYHLYIQVNPTSYKVVKSSLNADGVAVDNFYHDNIIHLSVFQGSAKVFSRDFNKRNFAAYIDKTLLPQCILSDVEYRGVSEKGLLFEAMLAIPDTPSSYVVDLLVDFGGHLQLSRSATM